MPIRSSVTVSLVPESRGGPFVFWDDLPEACRKARALGFDGIEIFPPSAEAIDAGRLRTLLSDHGLALAAVGTGAGWLLHKHTITHPDSSARTRAKGFVRSIVDLAGALGAPAIIGSMQGRSGDGLGHPEALDLLGAGLTELGQHAEQYRVPLLFEPLNRYETNLVNVLEVGVSVLERYEIRNVSLLADLFHMNIEEQDIAGSILASGSWIGHIHFVDSNRRSAGLGHIEFGPIAAALFDIGYSGFASAEALPFPDPDAAARHTILAFQTHFHGMSQRSIEVT